jgi:hypothetical protein
VEICCGGACSHFSGKRTVAPPDPGAHNDELGKTELKKKVHYIF